MLIDKNTILFWINAIRLIFQHRHLTFILLNLKLLATIEEKNVISIYECTTRALKSSFNSPWQNSIDLQVLKNVVKLGEHDINSIFIKKNHVKHHNQSDQIDANQVNVNDFNPNPANNKVSNLGHSLKDDVVVEIKDSSIATNDCKYNSSKSSDTVNNKTEGSNNQNITKSKLYKILAPLRIITNPSHSLPSSIKFEDYQFAIQHLLASYMLIQQFQTQCYCLILTFGFGLFVVSNIK